MKIGFKISMLSIDKLPIKFYSYPQPVWLSYIEQKETLNERPDANLHRHQYYELLFFKEAENLRHFLDFVPYWLEPLAVYAHLNGFNYNRNNLPACSCAPQYL